MSIASSNFSELLDPGLKKIYGDAYQDYPDQYSKLFDVQSSTRNREETLSMTGFGLVPTKTQGASITYDDAFQGYKGTLTHSTYGMGFIVTREMYEDDQYNKINSLPKALARSVRHTIETHSANVLNRAFNSSYAGADAKEMCATDHPLIAGGTFKNELTTQTSFLITPFFLDLFFFIN